MDSEPEKRMELRRMLVDNYSVFYTIRDERVIVTDVLYTASDIEARVYLKFMEEYPKGFVVRVIQEHHGQKTMLLLKVYMVLEEIKNIHYVENVGTMENPK